MVRMRGNVVDRFDAFEQLPEDERIGVASAPNAWANERYAQIQNRGFLAERGIDPKGFESTPIPATIVQRAWTRYISTPCRYHPELVREFYAAMVPEVFKTDGIIWVKDTQVEMSAEAINEYLETQSLPEFDLYDGMPTDVIVQFSLGELSASLRRDGSGVWGVGEENMNHGDLHPDMAFWTVFIKSSLMPSSHRTDVTEDTARLLFAIQHAHRFDVGQIIMNQILKFGTNLRGLIYFPCLITHFCRMAGIAEASDEGALQAPKSDIGKKAYNHFCTHHNLPNLPTEGRRYRNRGQRAAAQPQDAAQPPRQPRQPRQQQPPQADIIAAIQEVRNTQLAHGAILERVADVIATPPSSPPATSAPVRPRVITSPLRQNRLTSLLNCFYARRRRRGRFGASSSRQQ